MDKQENKNNKQTQSQLNDDDRGSMLKELTRPENLIGPFESHEDMMKSLWDED